MGSSAGPLPSLGADHQKRKGCFTLAVLYRQGSTLRTLLLLFGVNNWGVVFTGQVSFNKERTKGLVPETLTGILYHWAMPQEEVIYVATQANSTAHFHIPPTPYDQLTYVEGVLKWYAVETGKVGDNSWKRVGLYAAYSQFLKVQDN